jgi:hypothetical protein
VTEKPQQVGELSKLEPIVLTITRKRMDAMQIAAFIIASFSLIPASSTKVKTFLIPKSHQIKITLVRSRNGCKTEFVERN